MNSPSFAFLVSAMLALFLSMTMGCVELSKRDQPEVASAIDMELTHRQNRQKESRATAMRSSTASVSPRFE